MTDKYDCELCGYASELQAPNDWCEECNHIVDAAVEAIRVARRVGVPKYGPSSWRDVSEREHLLHASEHITWWLIGSGSDKSSGEDHLSHAICRLAMAKALEDK